ncbi:sigma factor-like helix-turn-helix DNA-binding protein [Streptomyces sp. P9(2023)]|uniref:sigma factor-like helix-turn-helix DNA-binding protein n=1 Tax=Streptomyces sp. P9(2023) TaxID=3064394 RepID=UPI0028F44833|nr:sigma factor-like helix-turn-helix DNA-binding protein [Streptomyces sp. P9(2023)]MDT9692939.1 sigma factor-like helix-turn-helix DNA-binding protein [Streptomyces sp. P9(2023)]
MNGDAFLAGQFDLHHERLWAVARRMLGSRHEATEALSTARTAVGLAGIDSWLTTVVARVCVERLRARAGAPPKPWPGSGPGPGRMLRSVPGSPAPKPVPTSASLPVPTSVPVPPPAPMSVSVTPDETALADGTSLALFVVLDSLGPDERLALVLHDLFGLPLPEVARLTGRTTAEAASLTQDARRRIRGGAAESHMRRDPGLN